jgi:hypothetical protein
MIIKNGKRLDGMGDSMPIGSIIEFDGTEIPDGYEVVADEVILYNNEQGTTAEITLSDSVANYTYIEIFCDVGYTKVFKPNGKEVSLYTAVNSDTIYHNSILYRISEDKITPVFNTSWYLSTTLTDTHKLYRVVGHK